MCIWLDEHPVGGSCSPGHVNTLIWDRRLRVLNCPEGWGGDIYALSLDINNV